MIIELMAVVNDVLDAVNKKKRAEKLNANFPGGICVVDVGQVAMSKEAYDYLNSIGIWAALEAGGEAHKELKKLGVA